MSMSLAKKITLKGVVGDLEELIKGKKEGEKVIIMNVYGICDSHSVEETQYGPFVRFKGQFEAVNLLDNTVTRSGTMILPDVAADLLHSALISRQGESVQFGFGVGLKASKKSKTGYELTAQPLMKESAADPLAALRNEILGALPAPEGSKVADIKKAEKTA